MSIPSIGRKILLACLLLVTATGLSGCMELLKTFNPSPVPRPIVTENTLPPHQSWCYHTLANTECYAYPQDVPADRLVNVDPQSKYPLTPEAHVKAVIQEQGKVPPGAQ